MNKPFRGTRLFAGLAIADVVRHGLAPQDVSRRAVPSERREAPRAAETARTGEMSLRIEESARFHWARYEHLTRHLKGKFNWAAALLTGLILSLLGWKAQHGELISPERWLCGVFSGWFIMAMLRLGLFTCLAAPRFVSYTRGRLHISGLGTLRRRQILNWSIEHKVLIHPCAKPGAKLQICHRQLGWVRHWTMLMEEGQETDQLQRLLEAEFPCNTAPTTSRMRGTIPIEAGILS